MEFWEEVDTLYQSVGFLKNRIELSRYAKQTHQ
jgi:hypothetical protein